MNKPSILSASAATASTPGIFMASQFMDALRFRKPAQVELVLWPAERGTYRRIDHGELKDINGRPVYA